ncbi:hypothetical protein [Amycolatopsis silviterrae]|uniref:Mce-associated membrane protein n=1 Tax=Amycolatopsis silviterrae TaxID=1656914 RepID=A0ABW5HLB0_9PSEU
MATAAAEVTAEDAAATDADDVTPPKPGWFRRNLRKLAAGAVVGVLIVALIAFGTVWYLRIHAADADAQRRTAVLDAARQSAVNITSIDKNAAQQGIQRIVDGATGEFKDQFSQQANAYQQMLASSQVVSAGKVAEAGIVELTGDRAVVLAAATATVKNKDAPAGEQRVYRMRLTLQDESGRWLVSKLEFVP